MLIILFQVNHKLTSIFGCIPSLYFLLYFSFKTRNKGTVPYLFYHHLLAPSSLASFFYFCFELICCYLQLMLAVFCICLLFVLLFTASVCCFFPLHGALFTSALGHGNRGPNQFWKLPFNLHSYSQLLYASSLSLPFYFSPCFDSFSAQTAPPVSLL